MLGSVASFFNDSAGLEKVLRLFQSFAQVVIALSLSASDAAPWVQARSHFVVGRRFLRITKWVDAWQVAQEQFYNASQSRIRMLLAVTKFSCLGMYLFLEMFTITDAMKVTSSSWGPEVLQESLKFWFYALSASILLSIYDIRMTWTTIEAVSEVTQNGQAVGMGDSKKSHKTTPVSSKPSSAASIGTASIYKKLLIDCCDLLIPGAATGWIVTDPVTIGVTGCISSLLSMEDIWKRVQTSKKAASR